MAGSYNHSPLEKSLSDHWQRVRGIDGEGTGVDIDIMKSILNNYPET